MRLINYVCLISRIECCVGFVTWVSKTTTLACLDEPARQDKSL
jgi:hypothetical protein